MEVVPILLSIKNAGKILDAEIEIKGITVMAGVNNTGKSTVGKVLFCIFNSFYKIEQQIEQERRSLIRRIFIDEYNYPTFRVSGRFDLDGIADYIMSRKAPYESADALVGQLRRLLIEMSMNSGAFWTDDFLFLASEKILQVMNISDEEIFVAVLDKRLQSEFSMQLNNIHRPDLMCDIALKIKSELMRVSISRDGLIKVTDSFSLNTEVVYIDDPFALDDAKTTINGSGNHRDHLKARLLSRWPDSPVKDAIDRIITTKKLETVLEQLNKVCNEGRLIWKPSTSSYTVAYREGNSKVALDIKNVSTGLKTFVILKTLLLNGSLEENGIMVLDEPEIHLHPEWQLIFAELIVLMHKEYNMHILLNTHSPYFLDAIEVYSNKHGISSRCKYYLAEDNQGYSSITDVSDSIEKIYERLAQPLQHLEDLRYIDDKHI